MRHRWSEVRERIARKLLDDACSLALSRPTDAYLLARRAVLLTRCGDAGEQAVADAAFALMKVV
jgi:hypothetical protein